MRQKYPSALRVMQSDAEKAAIVFGLFFAADRDDETGCRVLALAYLYWKARRKIPAIIEDSL